MNAADFTRACQLQKSTSIESSGLIDMPGIVVTNAQLVRIYICAIASRAPALQEAACIPV
jgi:hypothetical protein